MPCFFNRRRIKKLRLTQKEQTQVYKELLKEKTDEELHEMSEMDILDLILKLLPKIRKNMKEDVKLIYV